MNLDWPTHYHVIVRKDDITTLGLTRYQSPGICTSFAIWNCDLPFSFISAQPPIYSIKMQNPNLDINFINFNQDSTSLGIGTRTGYKLFSMSSLDKLELIYESACRDVIIVERLFSSSLLALVSLTSPRKLRVCHFKKGTEICQYSYSNTILAVKLNRCRI